MVSRVKSWFAFPISEVQNITVELVEKHLEFLNQTAQEIEKMKFSSRKKNRRTQLVYHITRTKDLLHKLKNKEIPIQFDIKFGKKKKMGSCDGRCLRFVGSSKGICHIGKLGIDACRCKRCDIYFPMNIDYIQQQKKILHRIRCPCCNGVLSLRPHTNLRRTRIEELEAQGIIKRI